MILISFRIVKELQWVFGKLDMDYLVSSINPAPLILFNILIFFFYCIVSD